MIRQSPNPKQMASALNDKDSPLSAVIAIPPVFDFYFTPHRFSGLGAGILSKLLRQNGWEVRLLNFPLQKKKGNRLALPHSLDFLKPHIIGNEEGRLSFFTRYQRFGPPFDECAAQVVSSVPDIVFISCFAFCYADAALELATSIRCAAPDIPIAIGGAGVSAYPDFFIRNANIDFALTGEAEISIPPFLSAIQSNVKNLPEFLSPFPSGIPNLYQKNKGKIVKPLIKKQTKPEEIEFVLKKTRETRNTVYFTTSLSRGCPKKCRFCSNFLCHGRDFRVIPIKKIKKELSLSAPATAENQKTVYINFEDDNLLLAPEYFLDVLTAFREKFPNVFFLAENGLDYTQLSAGLVKTLITQGMKQFNLSIASTHIPILEAEQRDAPLPLYENVVRMLDAHAIRSITYFICGFKKDSKSTVAANIAYLAKQPTLIGISLFYPVPGISDFTDKTIFDASSPILCAGSAAFNWNQSLTTAELITAFRLSRFVNLLKSRTKSHTESLLIQKIIKDQKMYTLIRDNSTRKIIPVENADNDMVRMFFDHFPEPFELLPYN